MDPHHSNPCRSRVSSVCHLLVTFKRLGFLKLGHWPHPLEKKQTDHPPSQVGTPSLNRILYWGEKERGETQLRGNGLAFTSRRCITILKHPLPEAENISILKKGEQLEPKSENSNLLLFLAQRKILWVSPHTAWSKVHASLNKSRWLSILFSFA